MSRHDISGILVKYAEARTKRAQGGRPPVLERVNQPDVSIFEEPIPGQESTFGQIGGGATGAVTGRLLSQAINRARGQSSLGRNPLVDFFRPLVPLPDTSPQARPTDAGVQRSLFPNLQDRLNRLTLKATSQGRSPTSGRVSTPVGGAVVPAAPGAIRMPPPPLDAGAPAFAVDDMDDWRWRSGGSSDPIPLPPHSSSLISTAPVMAAPALLSQAPDPMATSADVPASTGRPIRQASPIDLARFGGIDMDGKNIGVRGFDPSGHEIGRKDNSPPAIFEGPAAAEAAWRLANDPNASRVEVNSPEGGRRVIHPRLPPGGGMFDVPGLPRNRVAPRTAMGKVLDFGLNIGLPALGAGAGSWYGGGVGQPTQMGVRAR